MFVGVQLELRLKNRSTIGWVLGIKTPESPQKGGPKNVFSGAPGRGVLQKMGQAYRRPVHFLAFLAIFTLFGRI